MNIRPNRYFSQLQQDHNKLLRRQENPTFTPDELVEQAKNLLNRFREAGLSLKDEDQRLELQSYARHWGLYIYKNIKQSPKTYPNTFLEEFQGEEEEKLEINQSWQSADDFLDLEGIYEGERTFYGRSQEITDFKKIILEDKCKLIVILGPGGIGKTALAAKLWEQIQEEKNKNKFKDVIWRSLQTAPYIDDLLIDIIPNISELKQADLPKDTDGKIFRLINCLNEGSYLLILDNFESIIQAGTSLSSPLNESTHSSSLKKKYKGYGELIRQIVTNDHKSCLILTSREKSQELADVLKSNPSLTFTLYLEGLPEEEGVKLLKAQGVSNGSENKYLMKRIVDDYAGNPFALQAVGARIREYFHGEIAEFYKQSPGLFRGVYELIDEQFSRLSQPEQAIMYRLAIAQKPISIEDLKEHFIQHRDQEIKGLIKSLERRSLIKAEKQKEGEKFKLHPLVIEYVLGEFIERINREIVSQKIHIFNKCALLEAQAQDNVREVQLRHILEPTLERLKTLVGNDSEIENRLDALLPILRERYSNKPGYAAGNILNLFCRLKIDLSNHDFSKLTVWQAYLKEQRLHRVNFAYSNLKKSVFAQTLGGIGSVAFDSDGDYLATGDTEGRICLWQVAKDEAIASWTGHNERIRTVAFSPTNDCLLASGSDDKTIKIWELQKNDTHIRPQETKTLDGHEGWIWSIAFSPDGQRLASGSDDRTVKLWDAHTGECLKTFEGHADRVLSVAFSYDGNLLASCGNDQTIKLWDLETGKCSKTWQDDSSIRSIAFSPADANILASCNEDSTIELWDLEAEEQLKTLKGHTRRVWSIAFRSDGQFLASASDDKTVRLWKKEEDTWKFLKTLEGPHGHTNWVRSVAFHPNPELNLLVSGGEDKTVKLWQSQTGQCIQTLQGSANRVWSVAFPRPKDYSSSDPKLILASGNDDQAVRLWDAHTGKCLEILEGHQGQVRSVAFHPHGQLLASGSEDQTVKLWDANTRKLLNTLEGHADWVRSISFSPDGNLLASGSDDRTVRLWNARTGKHLKTLGGHSDRVWSVAFSPDGKLLASCSEDKTVKLWDVRTGDCRNTLREHTSWVWSVAFNHDGQFLASGSDDTTVRLWNIETGKCHSIFRGHTSRVWSVAFSPKSNLLASGSDDRTVKLWDADTGEYINTLSGPDGHTSWIQSVAFSPDGQLLASGSEDQSIKLWNIEDSSQARLMNTLTDRLYEEMNIKGVEGLSKATITTLKSLGAVEVEQ